ncbi:MAG: translation initiation factor IF-3 [Microgenomates group bacterium]
MRTTHSRFQKTTPKKFHITNWRIEAAELRVLSSKGEQIGVMSKADALAKAQAEGLDLVLIAERATPPVAKIIDFKKFLYQEEKKQKEARKGIKKGVVKDIKLSLFIGPADLERMILKGIEFLKEGNQVRLNLGLRGREMGKTKMAYDLINSCIAKMGEVNVAKEPKLEGRVIRAVIAKKK